jgi:hypothetical protein
VVARFVKSFDKVEKCLAEGSPQKAAMTAMATMCVVKGVPFLVEVVARLSAVLTNAIVAMQYSNNPTLHRYLPTRAILLAELEALRADAMSRKSKLDIYGLTPLPSDNENLVFAKENMVAVTAEIAPLTDAIVITGLGVACSLSIYPLLAAATMLHPEFGHFAYVKDDSLRSPFAFQRRGDAAHPHAADG